MKKALGFIRLTRPPNLITAVSDVLAGVAIAGSLIAVTWGFAIKGRVSLGELLVREPNIRSLYPILMLVLATILLYAGGVVLNDVFDARLDKKERPERPIPSGVVSQRSAAVFGVVLLAMGIISAALSNPSGLFSLSTLIAALIAVFAVVYDRWMKHSRFFGPVTMGMCRGLNLLLGISVYTFAMQFFWYLIFVPVIYIAAITMISRGEVHGGKRTTLYRAAFYYLVVLATILVIAFRNHNADIAVLFIAIFALLVIPPLRKAILDPQAANIGKAVKSGVIGLIAMNASWAAAFGDPYFALAILLLFPVSVGLARLFAVT